MVAGSGLVLVILFASLSLLFSIFSYLSKPADLGAAKTAGQELLKLKNQTVMMVGAHPDDVDWYCGGTLSVLHNNGNKIVVVVATSGEKGADLKNLAEIREKEQLDAAKIMGYDDVVFLRLEDRKLKANISLVAKLNGLIDKHNPSVLFTFDSKKEGYVYRHPDHRASSEATLNAVKSRKGIDLYFFHSSENNVVTDIGAVQERKTQAMSAHKSQRTNSRIARYTRFLGFLRFFRSARNRGSAQEFESINIKYGEVFRKQ